MKDYNTLHFLINKKIDKPKCIVMGNGMSVKSYIHKESHYTIGVNDICKFFTPNILLLVDTKARFERKGIIDRMHAIANATPDVFVFQDVNWEFDWHKSYILKFGKFKQLKNLENKDIIDIGLDSPYMGVQLAYKMGFKEIAIIGVDFTPHHFYKNDGEHDLVKCDKLSTLNSLYDNLYKTLKLKNVKLYNLNKNSKITTIPFIDMENF